jgi:hypothetical protein
MPAMPVMGVASGNKADELVDGQLVVVPTGDAEEVHAEVTAATANVPRLPNVHARLMIFIGKPLALRALFARGLEVDDHG